MHFDKISFDIYSYLANETAVNQGFNKDLNHFGFGLLAEAGEVANILQKYHRGDSRYYSFEDDFDDEGDLVSFTQEARDNMAKELGDVLWHVAALADIFEIPLSEVAQMNLDKLADRGRRKVIKGDGDDR